MNGINRITLHHEGWEVVNFTDVNTTMTRLQHIQRFHMKDRGWGDVGYHYIIDRAGRVWEARPIQYQGAHVADMNEHNVGIMVLGNFEKQLPSNIQMASAQMMTSFIMGQYSVPVHRVYTHQELKPTQCPGRNLQPRLVAMRRSGYLG
jgi:N-acetyl-anhydromuramyl-L-alanine amidase AmpD